MKSKKHREKSTKTEILAAILSVAFTGLIITLIALQEFFPPYAEQLVNFIITIEINLVFSMVVFGITGGIFLLLISLKN